MRARVLELATVSSADTSGWADLYRRASTAHPYLDPVLLASAGRRLPDAAQIRMIVVGDGPRMMALLPFAVEPRWGRVPVPVLSNRAPFLFDESSWLHPLLDARFAGEALTFLIRALPGLGLPGVVELERVPDEGPFLDALTAASIRLGSPLLEQDASGFAFSAFLPDSLDGVPANTVEGSLETVLADFVSAHSSRDTRRRYARKGRALADALDAPLVVVDRSSDPTAIDEFLALQAAGWKGDVGAGGSAYRVRGRHDWFSDMTVDLRHVGRLVVLALMCEGRTVYLQVAARAGTGLYAIADAYDETFAEHSAGTLGRIAVLNRLRCGFSGEFFDPCMPPRYAESTRLYPDRRSRARYVLGATPVARTLLRAVPGARRLSEAARSLRVPRHT